MRATFAQRNLTYVERLEPRDLHSIKLVVIHCTELPDLAMARVFGEKLLHEQSQTGNSGHFYIDRGGQTEQWVPVERVAHHVRGYNPESIGIELVNTGRYPDWFDSTQQELKEPYPARQIEALIILLNRLVERLPGLQAMTGHSNLDTDWIPSVDKPDKKIRRKVDPGPLFPWSVVSKSVPLKIMDVNEP